MEEQEIVTVPEDELEPAEETETETVESYSPGELAKLAGVRPQMVYNYIKNGLIKPTIVVNERTRIEKSVGDAWVEKYTTRKAEREAKAASEPAGLSATQAGKTEK